MLKKTVNKFKGVINKTNLLILGLMVYLQTNLSFAGKNIDGQIFPTQSGGSGGVAELKNSIDRGVTIVLGIIVPSIMIVLIASKAIAFGKGEKGAKEELVNTLVAAGIAALTISIFWAIWITVGGIEIEGL